MTEQVQKRKYVIKRVLSEEDVNKIREKMIKVLQDVKTFYYGLLTMIDEPAIKYYENNRQEAEKDMFLSLDVRHFVEKYAKAYVLHHLLYYGYLPDMASITITYIARDKVIVKVIVDKKELSYRFSIANHVSQSIEITSLDANENVTPKKIVSKLVDDIDGLIEMYRWDFENESTYRLNLEYTINWLRQRSEQIDDNKVKALTEIKTRIVNNIWDLEDLLREYRL
jgi:hypothetical protein